MARTRRIELFQANEIAVVHVMSRVVRRCFLMGMDPLTGKNYDHRKFWIEKLLERFAGCFGIDLIAFSLMSNHMHLVLRSRPDVVETWTDQEVATRWLLLCPIRKKQDGSPKKPSEPEVNSIANDKQKLHEIRLRLSDISWWMRLLNQRIAKRANREEDKSGRFWEGRFKSVRLLDEEAIIACAAYVDLNPVRAALADTIEQSDFTSIQRRIQAGQYETVAADGKGKGNRHNPRRADFLAPMRSVTRTSQDFGPLANKGTARCSDKGFTSSLSEADYIQLLDWTARQIAPGKRGSTEASEPPVLERLQLRPQIWCSLVSSFGQMFSLVAGKPQSIDKYRSPMRRQRFHMKTPTRQLFNT